MYTTPESLCYAHNSPLALSLYLPPSLHQASLPAAPTTRRLSGPQQPQHRGPRARPEGRTLALSLASASLPVSPWSLALSLSLVLSLSF